MLNNIMTTIPEKHNSLYYTQYMFYIEIQNCILCVLNVLASEPVTILDVLKDVSLTPNVFMNELYIYFEIIL